LTLLLRDEDVQRVLSLPDAVEALARDIAGTAASNGAAPAVTARSIARFDGGWLRIMSGTLPEAGVFGFKAFHLIGGTIRYVCQLYRLGTGEPLAIIDAHHLTLLRTSATAAAAARHHWGSQPISVGVIGSGLQAGSGLRALAAACEIREVRVHSPRPQSRERFAAAMAPELGLSVAPAGSAREACAGADLALCATHTGGRVALYAEDAVDVPYVSSISSTLPDQRELDEHLIVGAERLLVDTDDALSESGDLIAAGEIGLDRNRVSLLSRYLAEPAAERVRTVYKSIGSVEQDLSLAHAAWRAGVDAGVGQEVDPIECARVV
jgi:alanine dehydrogenase